MEKGQKGCLLLIGLTAISSVGIYIALQLEWLFFKNLILLLPAAFAPYIGEKYFSNGNKRTPKWQWALFIILIFLLAGLVTWWMKSY